MEGLPGRRTSAWAVLPVLTGCTHTINWLDDLSDAAHVDIGMSLGFLVNVGPALVGDEGSYGRIQLGLGVHADAAEFAGFVTGIFGGDVVGDDL